MAEDPSDALRWIDGLLDALGIPYQVVGGLAARCYGSTRPLFDIDLYVPDDASLERIASAAADRITRPPTPHRDEHWELSFLAMEWGGWRIEIAAASEARVWDRIDARWTPAAIRFEDSEMIETGGVRLPVIPRDDLIRYKMGLAREVDRLDVEALEIRK